MLRVMEAGVFRGCSSSAPVRLLKVTDNGKIMHQGVEYLTWHLVVLYGWRVEVVISPDEGLGNSCCVCKQMTYEASRI